MDPWQSVGTPLEYWFFRTSWPAGALLVDVIRRGDADQTRVSYHHEGVSGVVRSPGACELTERKSTGEIGTVTWDLAFARGSSAVAGLLRSRLWGLPVPLPPLGYAWVRDGRERYVATPLTGLIRRMPAGDGGLDLRVIAPGGGW